MKVPLSPRLQACCNFIAPGDRVADVGTDHGYLGIWLLQQGIASSIIASDIVPGPLEAAKGNARRFDMDAKMEFYLSDGAQSIPRDFHVLVCAGMGAVTMCSILEAAPWLQNPRYRLVLQCQHKTHLLRHYLSQHGWNITREAIIKDGRFLYTVLEARFEAAPALSAGQCFLPPALAESGSAYLAEYYQRTCATLRKILAGQGQQADPYLISALHELENHPIKEEHNDNR